MAERRATSVPFWRKPTTAVSEPVYTPAILLLSLTVGVSYLGLGFVMPLRALYSQQVGASSGEIGLMASAALLTGFLAAPPIGWLTDRAGHRRVLWMALFAHAVLVLAYAFVRDPIALIGLRALEGIAIIGVLPPARALMNALAPGSRQGEALGLLSSAQMVGILLGPALGTLLANQVGYVPAFVAACVPLFLGALLARLLLPAHPSRPAAVPAQPDATPQVAAGGWREQFSPRLWLVYALAAVLAVTQGTVTAIWSLYMVARGASLPVLGLSYTTYALPAMLLTPLAGRFSDRHGRYGPILAAFLSYAVIYLLFGLPVSPFWLVIISAIEGVIAAAASSALGGLLADVMPAAGHGKAQANYSAANTLGAFLSATGAGFLYALAPGAPFVASSVVFLAVSVGLLLPPVARLFPPHGTRAPSAAESTAAALNGAMDDVVI
jgi:DHA1 family multidrug resistance protein-like MFS transporter